jgi:hypothetical protein
MKPLTEGNMKSGVKEITADGMTPIAPPPAGRTAHHMTEEKVKLLTERQKMEVTGYILMDDTRVAFVDHSRVRWYDRDEAMIILGHEEKQDGKD